MTFTKYFFTIFLLFCGILQVCTTKKQTSNQYLIDTAAVKTKLRNNFYVRNIKILADYDSSIKNIICSIPDYSKRVIIEKALKDTLIKKANLNSKLLNDSLKQLKY